jgi:hypothetical protein
MLCLELSERELTWLSARIDSREKYSSSILEVGMMASTRD